MEEEAEQRKKPKQATSSPWEPIQLRGKYKLHNVGSWEHLKSQIARM